MLYLAQGGTMDEAAIVLGISRPRAVVYINDCLGVPSAVSAKYVLLPGAVDGTLIAIPRPHDFEGWYCRKGFPAVNVQAVVDHREAFRSISIRAGSNNDQSLWNGSGIRKRLHEFVPPGKYVLGDAGYKIWVHLLTPFPESEVVADRRKRVYNRSHSRTRMAVECAFGRLKNRFRILLGKLEQKTPQRICKVIYSYVVLHNMLLHVKNSQVVHGSDPLPARENQRGDEGGPATLERPVSHSLGVAKRNDLVDVFIS
ncbi:hypothetical protein PI125_g20547 [Phytophthora idaei]|nr:hypothetical protein PI125_g20547 [Phytophthora idaei]KAG3129789.1 hypothetical protein PI126_g20802 [Phytophthora idaei]